MPNPVMPNDFDPIVSPGGYSHGSPDGVIRTQVEGGFNRYALDFDRGVQVFNVTLLLTPLQYSVWTVFFYNIIKKGAITFDMNLDSGFGLVTHSVNILPGTYDATNPGGHWIITFQCEGESKAFDFTADESQELVDIYNTYGALTGALLDALNQYANFDSDVLDF